MNSGGGASTNTTVCARCGLKLVWNTDRRTWLSEPGLSMYCPTENYVKLPTIHRPVAGESR